MLKNNQESQIEIIINNFKIKNKFLACKDITNPIKFKLTNNDYLTKNYNDTIFQKIENYLKINQNIDFDK